MLPQYISHLCQLSVFQIASHINMSDQSLLDGIENGARLKIEKSSLVSDGLGLTASAAIPAAEDVFSKQQLLHIADNPHFSTTCDNCFMWLGDSVNLKTNTISAWNAMPMLKKCSGCQVVRYCSNVSQYESDF